MVTIVLTTILVLFLTSITKFIYDCLSFYWLTPRVIKKSMEKQGVRGPSPRFLVGNILDISNMVKSSTSKDMNSINHDIVGRILPHFDAWSKQYGKRFIYWNGVEPRMCLMEIDLIKELLSNHTITSGRSWQQRQGSKHFIGTGLLMANGQDWYNQRHMIAPAFMGNKLKSYALHMVQCTKQMLESLQDALNSGQAEIEIGEYMTKLTADIIARTEFGSSYGKGKQIFYLLTNLQERCAESSRKFWFPGSRYFPSKYNSEIKFLKKEVDRSLMEIIQGRIDSVKFGRSSSYGDDLLGMLLSEMHNSNGSKVKLNLQHIMDECKTFFFAGHETTALLLTWTMMLLATNPSWQEKIRSEVDQVCQGEPLTIDHLPKLTVLNMVINESLRLYPPATLLPRMAFQDIKLGDLHIPKGLSIWIPTLAIHHSKELWGEDANEFNPERFAQKTYALGKNFIPFASGPRNCVGQSFAIMEAKIILAMLVSQFSFGISENYRHAPVVVLTIKPKYGVQVVFKRFAGVHSQLCE